MIRPLSVALVLAFTACASNAPRPDGPAGPEVTLKFAWPQGVTAKVRSEQRKERQGQEHQHSVIHETHRWETSGSELIVHASDVDVEGEDRRAVITEQMPPPSEVVDATTGRFIRLDGVDAAVASLRAAMGESGKSDEMAALLRSTLVAASETDWDAMVGYWNGKTVRTGRGGQDDRMVPGLPGTERMKVTYTYRAERAVPCNARTVVQKCLLLTATIEPDPKSLPELGSQFLRAMSKASGRDEIPPVKSFAASTEVEVVTEPDTLLPHRFTKKLTMKLQLDLPGQGTVDLVQAESEDAVFTYDPPR